MKVPNHDHLSFLFFLKEDISKEDNRSDVAYSNYNSDGINPVCWPFWSCVLAMYPAHSACWCRPSSPTHRSPLATPIALPVLSCPPAMGGLQVS